MHGSRGRCLGVNVIQIESILSNDMMSECFTVFCFAGLPLSLGYIRPTPLQTKTDLSAHATQGRPLRSDIFSRGRPLRSYIFSRGRPLRSDLFSRGSSHQRVSTGGRGLTRFKPVCIQEGRPSKSFKKLCQQALMAYL